MQGCSRIAAILLVILATHQGLASAPKGAASQVVEEINRRMGLYTWTKYVKAGDIEDDYYRVIEDPSTGTFRDEYDILKRQKGKLQQAKLWPKLDRDATPYAVQYIKIINGMGHLPQVVQFWIYHIY